MNILLSSFSSLFTRPDHTYRVIDGIRALATLWIIIAHTWVIQLKTYPIAGHQIAESPFLSWITRGELAVDLLFLISGFLIGTILFQEFKRKASINFKKFYTRRFFRIIPIYALAVVMNICFTGGERLESIWSNVLFINNYVRYSYMPWTWTLAIEGQFYVVAPFLIAFILPRFKRKYFVFLILAVIPVVLTYHYYTNIYNFSTPFNHTHLTKDWYDWFWGYFVLTHLRYGGIIVGLFGAYLNIYHRDKIITYFQKRKTLNNILIVISILLFILISVIYLGEFTKVTSSIFYEIPEIFGSVYAILHREVFNSVVLFLILACIYSASIFIKPIQYFLSLKIFYPIAQVSYAAYLFHVMFMLWYFPKANEYFAGSSYSELSILLFNGLVALVAILFVSTIMYVLVEEPFNKLRNRLTLMKKN